MQLGVSKNRQMSCSFTVPCLSPLTEHRGQRGLYICYSQYVLLCRTSSKWGCTTTILKLHVDWTHAGFTELKQVMRRWCIPCLSNTIWKAFHHGSLPRGQCKCKRTLRLFWVEILWSNRENCLQLYFHFSSLEGVAIPVYRWIQPKDSKYTFNPTNLQRLLNVHCFQSCASFLDKLLICRQ